MSQNLLKRISTSIILLSILIFVTFINEYIFIISIYIVGGIICLESNNMFLRLVNSKSLKNKMLKRFDFKFLILNLTTFLYVFFVFCALSIEIYSQEGSVFFLYLISICFFTDIGGYTFGKIIGGKKLSEISPNKTISGTIGSFLFSLLPIILFKNLNYLDLEFNLKNITFCLLVSLISQLGDLSISYLKRKSKIKDTGKILPGHGGVLDRVDGIIFAVPCSYLLLKII
jgi:phosphatidate cytidylyltransferase